jgi:hypothetical protein
MVATYASDGDTASSVAEDVKIRTDRATTVRRRRFDGKDQNQISFMARGVSAAILHWIRGPVLAAPFAHAVGSSFEFEIYVGVYDLVAGRSIADNEKTRISICFIQEMVTIASTSGEADACTGVHYLSTAICHKDELTLKHVDELILLGVGMTS